MRTRTRDEIMGVSLLHVPRTLFSSHSASPTAAASPSHMPALQRQALRRLMLALPSYAGAMLLMYSGAWLDLFPWEPAHVVASFAATGLFGFWLLLHSGATLRWRDPMAVLPQTLFSVLIIALTYHLIEVSRSVTLLWLAVIVIYDMRRLPIRHVIWVIATATTCQLLNFASIWASTQDPDVRIDELMNLGCMALLLPTLAYVSANARATVKRRKRQNQEMSQTLEALGFLSVHDSLTGLHNRRRMLESLQQEARKARRFKRPFVVAILDIDHFKRVNDGHGHAVGDAVLKAFASLVAAEFSGPVDASARWGGEEFVVLMPETDAGLASQRLQALRDCVHAFDWSAIRPGLRVTFSAGMAEYHGGTVAQLIDQADRTLYDAKHLGRDRVMPHIEPDAALAGVRAAHAEKAAQLRLSSPPVADSAAARWQQALAQDARRKAKPALRGTRDTIGWVAWLLGPDRAIRKQMKMVLISSAMYLFWLSAVLFHSIPNQLFPTWLNVLLVTHITLGAVVPPLLIRSGWSQRLKDPGLVAEQIIWSSAMLVAGYTFSPLGKGGHPGRAVPGDGVQLRIGVGAASTPVGRVGDRHAGAGLGWPGHLGQPEPRRALHRGAAHCHGLQRVAVADAAVAALQPIPRPSPAGAGKAHRCHRAGAPPDHHRCADRPVEPSAPARGADARVGAQHPPSPRAVPGPGGPGPLQARQRHAGTPGGRRGACRLRTNCPASHARR